MKNYDELKKKDDNTNINNHEIRRQRNKMTTKEEMRIREFSDEKRVINTSEECNI